jgi:ABC-type branched-subunit amino acid transport system substrate-binding protein
LSKRLARGATAVACAAVLAAAAGCSTKADEQSSGTGAADSVKTGPGVSGSTIRLGLLMDLSGVFASQGKDLTDGAVLYWKQQNAKGGVCGKYQVELDVKDHGYSVQTATQLYSGMSGNVLALQETLGSPINTALAERFSADEMVNIPAAWARNLTDSPLNAVVGSTYDVEVINTLAYALEKGLIKEGDPIAHIYFEGELGANGLAGSKYFAGKHGMNVLESKIKPSDSDMSSQVTSFKAAGAKAIVLSASPSQLASVATASAAQGLDVPLLGNSTNFAPGLLNGPAGQALKTRYVGGYSYAGFDRAPELLTAVKELDPSVPNPSTNVVWAYAAADVLRQVLDKACANGDLTRQGVAAAKQQLTSVETGGLVVPLDLSRTGVSPSPQSFLFQPSDQPGGLKELQAGYESADLADYPQGG